MRTTIEIKDKLRAELLKRTANEGAKGFSHIIEAALESYFDIEDRETDARKKALGLKGCLGRQDSERLRAETGKVRETWR
jgi:Arc/MetJ family transcription regulator